MDTKNHHFTTKCHRNFLIYSHSLILLVILLTLASSLPPSASSRLQMVSSQKDRLRYRTAYACEGGKLEINCEDGTLINLIRANYGRFSISICNEHGNLDWSVDCTAQRTFYVVSNSCRMKKSCTLSASSLLFDDPCPGTLKYLEAHYQCVSEPLSSMKTPTIITLPSLPSPVSTESPLTASSSPPLSLTSPSSLSSSLSPHTVTHRPIIVPLTHLTSAATTVAIRNTSYNNEFPGDPTSSPSSTPIIHSSSASPLNLSEKSISISQQLASTTTMPTTISTATISKLKPKSTLRPMPSSLMPSIVTVPSTKRPGDNPIVLPDDESIFPLTTFSPEEYCPSIVMREIKWPITKVGSVMIEPCPSPTHGSAKWECSRISSTEPSNASWTSSPDLSDCTSSWIYTLRQRMEKGDVLIPLANDLTRYTRSSKLYGGDIIQTTQLLQSLVNKMGTSVGEINEDMRHGIVKELIQSVIEVSSNILEPKNRDAWYDLNVHSRRAVASQLIRGLENAALLLAATQNGQYDFNRAHTNVLVSVRLVDAKESGVKEMHFPSRDTVYGTAWMVMQESLTLPLQTSVTTNADKPGVLKVVFLAYRNVQDFLTPFNSTGIMPKSAEMSALTSPSVSSSNVRHLINSKVMTLSLVGETNNAFNVHLAQPIELLFKHLKQENVSNPQCVFWDYNISEWSSDGCWVLEHNKSHTLCSCNHLTSFALLMDINGPNILPDPTPFPIGFYIVLIISLAFLAIIFAVIIFVWSRLPECVKRKKPPPPDGLSGQTGQTANHLFSIATPKDLMPPPSPLIRPSGHNHNQHNQQHHQQIHGSLQQLSLPYPYWNTRVSNPPQYEEQQMDMSIHKSAALIPDIQSQSKTSSGFITHGPQSITQDVHLIDSASYQSYSPSFHANNKSLARRSLRTAPSGAASSSLSNDRHPQHPIFQHQSSSSESNRIPSLSHVSNVNNLYGGGHRKRREIPITNLYPGKYGYQISPIPLLSDMPPQRPPLPDHIYECIDDDCYCFNGDIRKCNSRFYREFESPARVSRPPPLRSATLAPAFRDLSYQYQSSSGSERNLLRTIAASVLNNSNSNRGTNESGNFSDSLIENNSSSMIDCDGDDHFSMSNEAIELTSSTDNSSSESSCIDDRSDDSNQSDSNICGIETSPSNTNTPNSLTNRSTVSDVKVVNNHHKRDKMYNHNYNQSEPSSPLLSRNRYNESSSLLIKLNDSGNNSGISGHLI